MRRGKDRRRVLGQVGRGGVGEGGIDVTEGGRAGERVVLCAWIWIIWIIGRRESQLQRRQSLGFTRVILALRVASPEQGMRRSELAGLSRTSSHPHASRGRGSRRYAKDAGWYRKLGCSGGRLVLPFIHSRSTVIR